MQDVENKFYKEHTFIDFFSETANKTVKIYPILINSTSNASLGTVVESMTGSSGSSFSVSGTSRGVIVTNTSGLDQRVSVRFDIAGI